jgi:hypothetical protein
MVPVCTVGSGVQPGLLANGQNGRPYRKLLTLKNRDHLLRFIVFYLILFSSFKTVEPKNLLPLRVEYRYASLNDGGTF